ncbi:hypothetical protein FK513_31355, partial [Klebsiella pneumoniae]|nr:hypothetical protein [Klebsiella pneumoniae]
RSSLPQFRPANRQARCIFDSRVLNDTAQRICLDCFAGSGALGRQASCSRIIFSALLLAGHHHM